MSNDSIDLSVVIVNYNTREMLSACLRSVYDQTQGITFEVIVVDNASTDGSGELVRTAFPDVRIILNTDNRGFAAANNQGFEIARGRTILMLNSDTIVLDKALQRIVSFIDETKEAAIVGCRLLNKDRSLQTSVRSFPDFWNVLWEAVFLYRLFPGSAVFGRYYLSYFSYQEVKEVDWVSGACMAFRRDVLDAVGGLDEQFFMFSEEVDFCKRAKQAGLKVWFFPGAEVVHLWAGSTVSRKGRVEEMHRSQLLYFRKHFSGASLIMVLAAKVLGMILRVVVYSIGGMVTFDSRLLRKAMHYGSAIVSLRW